jgi:hypothetical protein
MNRHHTEYLRKVRANNNNTKEQTASSAPRSQRVGVASDMAKEIQRLEKVVTERNEEIERLCALLDAKDI